MLEVTVIGLRPAGHLLLTFPKDVKSTTTMIQSNKDKLVLPLAEYIELHLVEAISVHFCLRCCDTCREHPLGINRRDR